VATGLLVYVTGGIRLQPSAVLKSNSLKMQFVKRLLIGSPNDHESLLNSKIGRGGGHILAFEWFIIENRLVSVEVKLTTVSQQGLEFFIQMPPFQNGFAIWS
jgi:hypothetical protein